MRVAFDETQQLESLFPDEFPAPRFAAAMAPEQAQRAGALAAAGAWRHSLTGMMVPRGMMLTSAATPDDYGRLAEGSERRGVQAAGLLARRVKRSARDEAQLQAICEWLDGYQLDIIGSVSFSDAYAASHGVYSLSRALEDVWQGLHEIPMVRGTIRGYRGRYVLAGEWHPSGRNVPHVHLALDSMGVADSSKVCTDLWRYFYGSRGRSRFEPMRDANKSTLYGLKDTVKASEKDPDCIRLKLSRHSSLKGCNR